MPHDLRPSVYPPSFEGDAWAFFFALFSLILVVSLAVGQILKHICEANRDHALTRRLGAGFVSAGPLAFWTPLGLYRWKISCLYLAIFFGAVGDVAVMLSWGEATQGTMETLIQLDRLLDAMTIIPFLAAVAIAAWSDQAIPAQLCYPEPRPVKPPKWQRVKGSVRILALIALIAMGVTIGKASS